MKEQPQDALLKNISDYVVNKKIDSEVAYQTAHLCLMDSLACGFLALDNENCQRMLGPVVADIVPQKGVRVPGTGLKLDPVQATFNLGAMIRWLDFNDTWLAQEWGHPSDNICAILMIADYLNRFHKKQLKMQTVLTAIIKAYEIQGVLALDNSFNRIGLDHVILVKVASTAVVTHLLGGNEMDVYNALSQAFIDGHSLRTYRHAPNTGSRKSWAAGDAASRAVWLALMTMRGEMGYNTPLSAPKWGFNDVYFKGEPLKLARAFDSYVIENILFKISFPAEFHAQTAVECAFQLHPTIKDQLDNIKTIKVTTQEAAMRIINKTGPLHNPADRDHCLQYMIAIGLIYGELTAEHYDDVIAANPLIDQLREKMQVSENPQFSENYLNPDKRSIGNSVQIIFTDGSSTDEVSVEYPIGHPRRRAEALPLLQQKFREAVKGHFQGAQVDTIIESCENYSLLLGQPVDHWLSIFS